MSYAAMGTLLSPAAGLTGLATAPIFIAMAIVGMLKQNPSDQIANVRFHAGLGNQGDHNGGHIPSVAVWDQNGMYRGYDHKHGHHIKQGGHRDEKVHTPGSNAPVAYMAVAAQKHDAICMAGVEISHPGSDPKDRHLILGDIGAACGMPWYHSRAQIDGMPKGHYPLCVWMGQPSAKRPDNGSVSGPHGTVRDPPAGFSLHIDDFVGESVNNHTAGQRTETPDLVCGHEARFKVWDDMRGHFKIPIFAEKPLRRKENGMDTDDFLSKAIEMSETIKHDIGNKRSEIEEEEEERQAAERRDLLLHGTLVKAYHRSAVALCNSDSSWGPDFFSHTENRYCHMATKTLMKGCSAKTDVDCFDVDKHEVRWKPCPRWSRQCKRSVELPDKVYKRVEDWSQSEEV